MCSKAGRNRKSLSVEKKLESPAQLAVCLGEGQVEGVGGRYDAEQHKQHYVHGHEGVAGALAITNPPVPGAALGSHRDGQAGGTAQCRGLRLSD